MLTFISESPEETRQLGRRLSGLLQAGDVLALSGELGAGKTCFIQGVARGLGVKERYLVSPSFVIMRQYRGRLPFYHIDLSQTVILCGIFAISVIAGIVSFFVPAGLGVREGILSYLLSLFIPISAAILISLVMRVWIASGELVCFLIALKIKKPEL